MTMKMTGGQILLDGLVKEGVDTVFGILGGAILPLYDTLPQFPPKAMPARLAKWESVSPLPALAPPTW
jgi:thiamine pyrophosphate-dependent acetolactate synthase large subunit-like protein